MRESLGEEDAGAKTSPTLKSLVQSFPTGHSGKNGLASCTDSLGSFSTLSHLSTPST